VGASPITADWRPGGLPSGSRATSACAVIHYVVNGASMVNIERELEREAEQVVRGILDDLGGFSVSSQHGRSVGDTECDVVIEVHKKLVDVNSPLPRHANPVH